MWSYRIHRRSSVNTDNSRNRLTNIKTKLSDFVVAIVVRRSRKLSSRSRCDCSNLHLDLTPRLRNVPTIFFLQPRRKPRDEEQHKEKVARDRRATISDRSRAVNPKSAYFRIKRSSLITQHRWLHLQLQSVTRRARSERDARAYGHRNDIRGFRSGDKAARLRKLTRFITTEDAPGRINALLESNQRDNVIIEVYARARAPRTGSL